MFRHPKYYKELRKRNKSDQVISERATETSTSKRAPGPGLKQQALNMLPIIYCKGRRFAVIY